MLYSAGFSDSAAAAGAASAAGSLLSVDAPAAGRDSSPAGSASDEVQRVLQILSFIALMEDVESNSPGYLGEAA